eukprot:UN00380
MVQKCRNVVRTWSKRFWKALIPFRKYIHYRDYFLTIFVKKAKRKISQTLNTWKMTEIFESLSLL